MSDSGKSWTVWGPGASGTWEGPAAMLSTGARGAARPGGGVWAHLERLPQPQWLQRPHAHLQSHLQSHLRGPPCSSKHTRTDVHLSGLVGPSWDMTAAIPNRAKAPCAPPAPAQSHGATPKPGVPSGTNSYCNDRDQREDNPLTGMTAFCGRGESATAKLPLQAPNVRVSERGRTLPLVAFQ